VKRGVNGAANCRSVQEAQENPVAAPGEQLPPSVDPILQAALMSRLTFGSQHFGQTGFSSSPANTSFSKQ
jgi:hypothetical protein